MEHDEPVQIYYDGVYMGESVHSVPFSLLPGGVAYLGVNVVDSYVMATGKRVVMPFLSS